MLVTMFLVDLTRVEGSILESKEGTLNPQADPISIEIARGFWVSELSWLNSSL